MKTILKSALLASALFAGSAAIPASAQNAPTGTVVTGLAVADLDGAVANSNAYKTAQTQRPVTYKAQIDQAQARATQLQAQIKPLADKFEADRRAANPNQASLQQQYTQLQQLQETGQTEINRILQPVAYSEAYVQEQIEAKVDQAVKTAMGAKKVSLLLNPQAVLAVNASAYNLTQDITNQLNTLIPSAQIVPPQGWEPRQVREARAQQAQQQGAAAAPAAAATPARPAGPQPQGR